MGITEELQQVRNKGGPTSTPNDMDIDDGHSTTRNPILSTTTPTSQQLQQLQQEYQQITSITGPQSLAAVLIQKQIEELTPQVSRAKQLQRHITVSRTTLAVEKEREKLQKERSKLEEAGKTEIKKIFELLEQRKTWYFDQINALTQELDLLDATYAKLQATPEMSQQQVQQPVQQPQQQLSPEVLDQLSAEISAALQTGPVAPEQVKQHLQEQLAPVIVQPAPAMPAVPGATVAAVPEQPTNTNSTVADGTAADTGAVAPEAATTAAPAAIIGSSPSASAIVHDNKGTIDAGASTDALFTLGLKPAAASGPRNQSRSLPRTRP